MKARYLYSEIASVIQARRNCADDVNGMPSKAEWFDRWTDRIIYIERNLLPSGSGIDNGTKIDLDASHAGKIVLTCGYHHMNDGGYYDGWTEHTITITPSFSGINLRISGRNRNDIKDYLHDVFNFSLCRMVEYTEDSYKLAS